jgi:small subunit ribosomal protein S9
MADETTQETEAVEETVAEVAEVAAEANAEDSTSDSTSEGTSEGTSSSSSDEEAQAEVDLEAIKALVSKPAKDARYQATGKRKTSVARVILTPGDGSFWVNGRTLEEYFDRASQRTAVLEPLVAAGAAGSYHVRARVHGGGITGQTGALRHGIAKALAEIDPAVRTQLKGKGFLKVDTRQVERKKAGLKKARKRPQFSKR